MKNNLLLVLCAVIFLQACQVKSGGNGGDELFSSHAPTQNQFALSTQLNRTYSAGEKIFFTLTFPKAVTISGTPKIDLVIGQASRQALFVSGSGSSSLSFSYLVEASDADLDGISVSSNLNLSGGSCFYDQTKACGTTIIVPVLTSVRVAPSSLPPNSAPVVTDFTAQAMDEDSSALITLPYADADGDRATACLVSTLVKLTVIDPCSCDGSGVCTVRVAGFLNQTGPASFNFQVQTSGQSSNTAKASLILLPVDDAPVSTDFSPPAFDEDTQGLFTLPYGDVDGDLATECTLSDLQKITISSPCVCASGVCQVGVTGEAYYHGPASFRFKVRANGVLSNLSLASLSITSVDNPPVTAAIAPPSFAEDTAALITLSYTDPDGDLATECSVSALSNVSVTEACACSSGICQVRVIGGQDYFGPASFSFSVKANGLSSNASLASLTIDPVQDPPVAVDLTPMSASMNAQKIIQLSYTDAEGDLASSCSVSALTHLSITAPCACSGAGVCSVGVTGETDYFGSASFQYTVTAAGQSSQSASVTFTIAGPGAPDVGLSSISGTGPVIADGSATSSITITLRDADGNPVSGMTPTFSATDTNSTNAYGACSSTSSSGVSICTLSSTKAEFKTLSITAPVSKDGAVVQFRAGAAVAANSTLTGTSPVVADGVAVSTISVLLRDAFLNPVMGELPTFSATDTGGTNTYSACTTTDSTGASTCTLSSLRPESKTLTLTAPVGLTGGPVVFTAGSAVAENSTITGTGPVIANGSATSTVTVTLKDANLNPVGGVTPLIAATDTGVTNAYGSCSPTTGDGVSTCTLTSLRAEVKTLSIVSPVSKSGGVVTFTAGAATATNSSISGTGPVVADGVAFSTVTVTLKDTNNNPVSGSVPTFSATNTGTTNVYGTCSSTDSNGSSTCTLKSTRAQVKTLSIVTPVAKSGGTVNFVAGAAAAAQSSITGTTPVSADGVSTSFISIYLKDAFANPIAGIVPIFNATDTNGTNAYGSCAATDSAGLSLCTLSSTKAEAKVLQLTSPVAKSGDTVTFSSALPTAANSSITGTTPVVADGSSLSTVTITLKDGNNNAVAGITPTFDATNTGSGNDYDDCSMSDAGGVSVCTMSSTVAELKVLRITSPVTKSGTSVVFSPGAASALTSTIAGTGPVVADGVATSAITITLKDANNNLIVGATPTFGATNTGGANTQTACSVTNASGVATCTLKSTKAESKIPSILTPVAKTGSAISFVAGAASATTSTITGTGPTNPDGVSTSTITITLKDAFNNLIASVVPTFTATGSANTYGTCTATTAAGVSTCTLASTTPETKTLNLTTPVAKTGGTVVFASGSAVAVNSSISATGPVVADGVSTSTITITLKDSTNSPVIAVVPTFLATGSSNTYGACSASNASGVSTCTLSSTKAEFKTVSIDSPVIKAGNSITFSPGAPSASTTTIEASGPHLANGSDQSTISVTILDAFANPISGSTPAVSVSGSSNILTACTVSNASGLSTCKFKSTKAEEKTVNVLTPVAVSGNTVDFNPNGINLQVPIEMLDKGAPSTTAVVTYARSRTSLNTSDYIAESNTYRWDVVADNTNTSTDYTIYLVDSAGVVVDDSAITIPANTTTTKRFSVEFTPNDGADNYRLRIPATPTASQIKVHSSRIIVEQYKAVATKIYIPLGASDALTDTSSDTGGQFSSTTSASFIQPVVNNYYQFTRNDSNYDAVASGTPWTLETLSSTSNSAGTATVALFDKANNLQIPEATTTVTGTTAISLRQVSFSSSATNFDNGDVLEARIRSSSTSYTTKVFKAGLWLRLKFLRKTEVPFRLVTRRSGTTSVTMGDARFLWDASVWSNPTAFFQVFGSAATQTVQLFDAGALDDTQTGTVVSTLTPGTTYGVTLSPALSLTNGSRYIIRQNRTSGTVIIGGAFVLIRAQE